MFLPWNSFQLETGFWEIENLQSSLISKLSKYKSVKEKDEYVQDGKSRYWGVGGGGQIKYLEL